MADGCARWGLGLIVIGAVAWVISQCSSEPDRREETPSVFDGPIPAKYQGAYNSVACSGGYVDGLVTIGGTDIRYGSGSFEAAELVSETENSITLRGRPVTGGGVESAQTFTLSFAPVGGQASLDGDEYTRCSQYNQ